MASTDPTTHRPGAPTVDNAAEFGVVPGVVPPVGDPLAETLQHLRMDGMFYCRSELSAPWGLDLPAMPGCLWFHVVTEGRCILVDHEGGEHPMAAGDVVVFPHGRGHRGLSSPGVATPSVFDLPHQYLSDRYAILRHGEGGERTHLVCGLVRMGNPGARSLIDLLPDVLRIDTSAPDQWQWLPGLLALMANETRTPRPGAESVVTRLCDIFVIQTIRSWIDGTPHTAQGWVGALRDPVVGPAIALIHRQPAHPWTVGELAAAVGMSRSAFAARFTELVGQPAKAYLTEWRMQVARDILGTESTSIAEIAQRLGYGSEAAFSRAYKRTIGEAPSVTRRQLAQTPVP
ncbi:MAG: AraC family transcriptional regulator [Actinomycetota bacterium]